MKLDVKFADAKIRFLDGATQVTDVIRETIHKEQEDPFYILDLSDIVNKVKNWHLKLPRVTPFYAVKCNDNQNVLEVLAALGTGFDCASKNEIHKIVSMGVDPSRIVFANPCKVASHIRYAANQNVDLMTFDNEAELYKVREIIPDARLVIRIRCDAKSAQCQLGMKYGIEPEEAPELLHKAHNLGLNVVGVSFHVGSGCNEPPVFLRAIAASRQVFNAAEEIGFNMTILDIGGGYPGHRGSSLDEVAFYINQALDEHFPPGCGVDVIAEPGRYMVASAFTLATQILGRRQVTSEDGDTSFMYYMNDGIYGSFNCILYDHQRVEPHLVFPNSSPSTVCSVWGPTCDGLDQVCDGIELPVLDVGDWLYWYDMGAYTLSAAGTFNGFPLAPVNLVSTFTAWLLLKDKLCIPGRLFKPAPKAEKCNKFTVALSEAILTI